MMAGQAASIRILTETTYVGLFGMLFVFPDRTGLNSPVPSKDATRR